MKRPIKFRGKDAYGKYRYGDLWQRNDGIVIMDNYCWHLVKPESVAQLIGYDIQAREVYEGDIIIDDSGERFWASLADIHRVHSFRLEG